MEEIERVKKFLFDYCKIMTLSECERNCPFKHEGECISDTVVELLWQLEDIIKEDE